MKLPYNRQHIRGLAKQNIPRLLEKRAGIVLVVFSLILLYLFRSVIEMMVVMFVFILLGVASLLYNRWVKVSLGIELIMLGTVTTGMLYGRLPALIVGMAALFFAEVITDRFTYSTFISFIGMFAIAMLIPLFSGASIFWTGLWLTFIYDAIILPGYLLLGSSAWRSFVFFVTHIAFNFWVFKFIAPLVMRVLS